MENEISIVEGEKLTIEEVMKVARERKQVKISENAMKRVEESRKVIEDFVAKEEKVYGVTTGFGNFKDVFISKEQTKELQENLIRSHAVGVGDPLPEEIVRAAMLLRINSLVKGHSGVRMQVIETLCKMLNKGVHPVIPEKGSVGASGDLAPLSHMVLTMMGEGEAFFEGKRMSGKKAMELAGIQPITLDSKEGLALNNGTAIMTAIGALVVHDAESLLKCADIAAAMTLEALQGVETAFDKKIHEVRPHQGQIECAENIRKLIKNSEILLYSPKKVQDAYTLRCIPQVHGASRDAIKYVKKIVEIEINSVTDNPIIFADSHEVLSGGNFHGQPIAISMDLAGIAISEIANISERRIARLVDDKLNEGLPAFLIEKGGLHNGYMIAQYTAAALVAENKILSHPASVDSIPTSANQEDHVSMGTIAARKAREILKNAETVIAIEMLCAAQAIDLRVKKLLSQIRGINPMPPKPGEGVKAAHEFIRKHVLHLDQDRILYYEVEKVRELVHNGSIVRAVEGKIGKLH